MKEELIAKVMATMTDKLTQEQLTELKSALYMSLQKYEVVKRNTELMSIDDTYIQYLSAFLIRKQIEGKSVRTIKHYSYVLKNLMQTLNTELDKITENDLFCYLAKYKQERRVSNIYLDNIRLVFSSFFTWLSNKGYIQQNPTLGLEPIKKEKKIKTPYSDEELEKLRCACKK